MRQATASDAILVRFLEGARGRARPEHLATYEDLASALQSFLAARRRRSLRAVDLRGFLANWSLRRPGGARCTRRLCAATLVLARWLTRQAPSRRRRVLRRDVRRDARAVARAARATELLETLTTASAAAGVTPQVDGYCEIVARGGTHVVLRALAAGDLLGPIEVPGPLAASLDPGTLVNFRLGTQAGRWCVLEYGYCHPAAARAALLEACARGRRA